MRKGSCFERITLKSSLVGVRFRFLGMGGWVGQYQETSIDPTVQWITFLEASSSVLYKAILVI